MEIQEIKTRLSIAQVLEYYNLRADGAALGKNARMCCPFHDDKTPSMQVYEKTNTVYCFSANCKTHGHSLDVIDFIMHQENITKHEALKKAMQMINPSGEMTKTELLTKLFNYFKNGLKSSPQARAYCQSRGLDYENIEIGFNGGQYHHGSRKDETLIKSCVQHGLLSVSSSPARTGDAERRPIAYNVFGKNCIVFALKDNLGQITGLYFRSIIENRNRKDATTRHFYLRDRKGLYPNYPAHYAEKLILTESIIDAGSLLQNPQIAQNYSVLALYGTNGLTDEHQKAIKSIKNLSEIIMFFDGDQAGREAVKKYAPMLKAGGEPQMVSQIKISVAECPESEDINSLLISHEPTVLEHLLETRVPFLFSNESSTENKKTEPIQEIRADNNVPKVETAHRPNSLDTSNPFNLIYRTEAITYCIKGGIKGNGSATRLDSLKISVQIINNSQNAERRPSDYRAKLDLYENKQIVVTAQATAEKLHLNHNEIEADLSKLTSLLEDYRDSQEQVNEKVESKVQVSESNTRACVNFLQQEKLLSRFNDLLGESGIIGEENNRLLLFVIATSYAMTQPLHALVQGSSGSGKTHLLLKIANLMPQEDTITLTRVTENSFYNYGENDLKNKLLCMEDLDGMKDEAFLAFRELQSRGMLTSSTSIKDETGNIKGVVKTVRGPVATLSATTKGEIYEDNMSRCFLVAVDETAEQTQRIISYQNQLSAGLIDRQKQEQIKLFTQNCLRLLRPYEVVNPFAGRLNLPPEAQK